MKKSNIDLLRDLGAKAAKAYTEEDKAFIAALSVDLGVEFKHRVGCVNCYADQVAKLYNVLKNAEPKPAGVKYKLRAGVDVIWCNYRICEASMTDKLAEELIAKGFPKRFFVCD